MALISPECSPPVKAAKTVARNRMAKRSGIGSTSREMISRTTRIATVSSGPPHRDQNLACRAYQPARRCPRGRSEGGTVMAGPPTRPEVGLLVPLWPSLFAVPLVREPPFFDEVLGQLQPHHQFANLRAGERELAFLRIAPRLEPPRPLLEKHPLPALELMGRHVALARDRIERLAAQEPQDEFRLPLDAPALRDFHHLRRRRFTARSRGWLSRLVLHARPP